jgi:hypothetical protein
MMCWDGSTVKGGGNGSPARGCATRPLAAQKERSRFSFRFITDTVQRLKSNDGRVSLFLMG